ncbi:MAG: bifunctional folylpolyglutamate synthase/dihydrofolate synthase [Arcobacteraceae bacterium]
MNTSLEKFLVNKSLYYDKIDYDIIKNSWDILSDHISLPYIIHIVGTNGKGSTGRFLASILLQLNQDVLHYSSPHIMKFNERIWINGADVSDEKLDFAHMQLQTVLPGNLLEKLTYFEYTTLLGFYLSDKRDYLVLEAGLGGEFDATNVVPNDLSIITTIGLDHQSFLGDTIALIAATKMRSCDKNFIISNQIYDEVYDIKEEVLGSKNEIERKIFSLNQQAQKLPLYLQNNLQTTLSVIDFLEFKDFDYTLPQLFGRYEKIAHNIIVDVGHNPLAALAIAKELKKENKKYILVYNSYADKDYEKVLELLHPHIQEVQIVPCEDKRIVEKEKLVKKIKSLSLSVNDFDIMKVNNKNNYFVFGSFLVVEFFLKGYMKG